MLFRNPLPGVLHDPSWIRPAGSLDYKVTQRFGCTGVLAEPPLGSCAHFHRGLDLGNAHCGGSVLAPAAGHVQFAQRDGIGSIDWWIGHGGGWFSHGGHLADLAVRAGQSVLAGQLLGHVGSTGAEACHLHFALKRNVTDPTRLFSDTDGQWVDPWPQLAQNVTVHPTGPGILIRATAGSGSTKGSVYAQSETDGHIHTLAGADLGPTLAARKWGGSVIGAGYEVAGVPGNRWEAILLGGAFRYVASPLAARSAS